MFLALIMQVCLSPSLLHYRTLVESFLLVVVLTGTWLDERSPQNRQVLNLVSHLSPFLPWEIAVYVGGMKCKLVFKINTTFWQVQNLRECSENFAKVY